MAPSASLNDHDDDGWDPAWDAGVGVHGASSAAHVSSWADFFAESNARTDAAMRAAGVDPKRSSKGYVTRHGVPLQDGLPSDKRVRCWGCEAPVPGCPAALECALCLETFRARANVLGHDDWERAFFCSADCYCRSWEVHRSRHVATTSTPSRHDPRVHKFPAAEGCAALWDGERLKRVQFPELT